MKLTKEHIEARTKTKVVLEAAGVSEHAGLYSVLVLSIANALVVEHRTCAALFCPYCAEGATPTWEIEFQGYTHIWEDGNGRSKCAAHPIWASLAEETPLTK